jgi:hypothetical protein
MKLLESILLAKQPCGSNNKEIILMAGKKEKENKRSKSARKGDQAAITNENENDLSDYRGDC